MALSTSIILTVSDYDMKMSRSLKFYKNDALKLIFTINYWGIDNAHGIPQKVLMPLEALSAVLFMETPDGTDSIEAGAVEGNVVTFYLNSEYTQNVGVSRMQIRLFDDDGCAITLPEFPFEIKENIYGGTDVNFKNVVLMDNNGNAIITEDFNQIDVGDVFLYGVEPIESVLYKEISDLELVENLDGNEDLIIQLSDGSTKRTKASEFLSAEVDLTGYATETYVQNKIAEASLSGGEVDLSGYVTEDELNLSLATKANKSELHTHANKTVLDGITSTKVTEWNNKSNFDGNYNSLTNKPTIPTVDVNKNYVDTQLATKANKSEIPSLNGYATETYVQNKIAEASLSGGEVDLSGYATKDELSTKADKTAIPTKVSQLTNDTGYLTSHQDISGKADKSYVDTELAKKSNASHTHSYNDLTDKPTIPSITGLATKEELNTKANVTHTHKVADITDLEIPRNTSDLTNDSGFITAIPDEYVTETELNNKNYATTTYVNTKISEAQLGGGSGGSGGVVDTTVTTSSGGFNSDGSLDSNSSFTHIDTYVNFESVSGGTIIAGTSGWWMFIYYDADKNYIGSYNPSSANTDYSISDIHSQKSDAVYFRASINQTTTISIIGVYNIDSSVIEKNVKDYGVIGDGITDDTNSIQGIISYVGQNGGGTIIFPEGEYKVTSPILIKYSNIYLKGEIGNKINYYGNGMDLNFIYVKGEYDNKLNNVTIDGLNLDGTNQLYKGGADDSDWLLTAPNPMSVGMTAICCTYCSNLKIINNTLNDFYGNGIIVRRCSFAFIEKNFLTDCSASGMASINTDFQGDGITAFMSFGVTVSNNIIINKRTFKTHNDAGWSSLTCDVYGKQCARSGLEFEYALNTDYESNPEKWCPYSDLISNVHGYALNFKNNYVYGYNKGIHLEHSINALIEGNSILHCNIGVMEATGGHIMIVNNEFDSDGVGASPQGGYDWYYASVALPHFLGTTFNNAIITGNRFRGDAAGVTYARNYISIKDNDFRNTGLCIEQKGDNLENILIEDNKFLLQDSLSSGTEKRILSLYTFGRSSIKNNNFVCENYHGTIYARIDSSVISGNIFKNVRFDLSLYNQYNLYNIFSNNVCVETIITDTATEFNFFGSHNSVISNNTFRGTKSICKAGGDNCVLENNIYVQDNNQLPADKNNADTISGYTIWVGSQTDYDALSAKDANTIYMIKG